MTVLLDLRPLSASRWQEHIVGVQGSGGPESVAPESFYEYRPNVLRANGEENIADALWRNALDFNRPVAYR